MAAQNQHKNRNSFAVMRWIDDGNRVSVHHFKYIVEPKKPFDNYAVGGRGLALFPGFPGQWQFKILAVGESKAVMETWLKKNKTDELAKIDDDVPKKKKLETLKEKEISNAKPMDQSQKELASILLKRPRESPTDTLQQDVNELKDEVKRLKRKVRELERDRAATRGPSHTSPPPHSPLSANPLPPSACQSPSSNHPLSIQSLSNHPLSIQSPSNHPLSIQSPSTCLTSLILPIPIQPPIMSSPESSIDSSLYNCHSLDHLKDSISHLDSLFDCCHALLLKLFSIEYLLSHSVSGQKSNSKTPAKPKFSERLYTAMKLILKQKFTNTKDAEITLKVQAVQKKYKNKSLTN